MSPCADHSMDDPRFEAAVELLIAADSFAHAIVSTTSQGPILATRVMTAVQLMVADTTPGCLYEEALVKAIGEMYPDEVRRAIVEDNMDLIRNLQHEPSAEERAHIGYFLRRIQKGE